jgi:hypothetical protein
MITTETLIKTEKTNVFQEETDKISIGKIGMKAGGLICVSLIAWFMVMKYCNLLDSPNAWGFNFIVLWAGIILAYQYYRSKTKLNVDYFPGLILGGITTAATVIPFVLFIYIYFSQGSPELLQSVKSNVLFMGEEITPEKIAGATMIEGMCSGGIISFTMMQYFKSGFRITRKEKSL